ncbi:MAG TPA: GAF domain-containing protein [Flavobacteriales bacterium]|nr:GAF domain-containing protein [Flavobacteriales bacterium]
MEAPIQLPGTTDRRALHAALLPQVRALIEGETDMIAAMANVAAAIHGAFQWHWVGFYRVIGNELVLGPFQGPIACVRIALGKGVCGTAWKEDRVLVVPDVDLFPGHIACSALSRSEIVVPIHDRSGRVFAVLDIDSSALDDFGTADVEGLMGIRHLMEQLP